MLLLFSQISEFGRERMESSKIAGKIAGNLDISPQNLRVSSISLKSWCGGGDLNPYALRRKHLKLVRLPISPPPLEGQLEEYTKYARTAGRMPARAMSGASISKWRLFQLNKAAAARSQ